MSVAEENHKRFLKRLEESLEAVMAVAEHLVRKGHTITIPGMRRAPDRSQWRKYADSGDLFVHTETGTARVEVKRGGEKYPFTGRDDWPHGSYYMVCAKHHWDGADPKPIAYWRLNHELTHVGIVWTEKTSDHWYVESRGDSGYIGERQDSYFCPLWRVEFRRLG